MVGIFLRQLDQMDHEGGQEDLTGILVGRSQLGGELQCNGRVLLPHLHRSLQAEYVIDGALRQAHGAGHRGTDDVLSLRGIAAVSLDSEAVMRRPSVWNVAVVINQALMAPICTLV